MTQGANDFQLTWKEIKKMDNMCCSGAGQTVSLLRRRCSDIRQSANQTLGVEHRDSLGSGGVLPPARIQSMKLCSHSVNIKENAVLILLCSSLWKILEHIPHAFLSNLPTDEKSSQYKDDMRYVYSSSENTTLDATSFFVLSHQKVPFKSFGLGLIYRHNNEDGRNNQVTHSSIFDTHSMLLYCRSLGVLNCTEQYLKYSNLIVLTIYLFI